MRHILIAVITLCFLMLSNANAHDAWIVKDGKAFAVVYGHGDKLDPYSFEKVKEVKAFDLAGKEIPVELKKHSDKVIIVPAKELSVLTLFFDNGFWLKTTDGWKNISKKEAKGMQLVEPAVHSLKYSKSLTQWTERITKPFGMRLEIVPLKNPLMLKVGSILPIMAYFDGKPIEGASINAGGYHKEDMKTDKNGMAEVKIESAGFQIIAAGIKIPLKDNPNADVLSLSANITFDVK